MCRASALYKQDFNTVKMEPLSLFYVLAGARACRT